MAKRNVFLEPIIMLIACAVVGGMAAMGKFTAMMGFPWIFGVICLFFGLLSLRQERHRALALRLTIVLLATALAVAGGFAQNRLVEKRLAATQQEVFAALAGKLAPGLAGLAPINTEAAVLEPIGTLSNKATLVTVGARWCSPCWTELPELEELYRQEKDRGLVVVAVTKYDQPDDDDARQSELVKNRDFLSDRGLTFPAGIAADDAIHRAYQVSYMPSTALIDEHGILVAYGVGIEGGREVMRRALDVLGDGS